MPSLNTENGVSNCGGRVVRTIRGRFCGNATKRRCPLANGIVTESSASADINGPDSSPPAPAAMAARRKRRRFNCADRKLSNEDMGLTYWMLAKSKEFIFNKK